MHGVPAVLAPRSGSFCRRTWPAIRWRCPDDLSSKGGIFVVGLVVGGLFGVVLVLYVADRIVKARARSPAALDERPAAAATARAEQQHEQRQAAERASQALISVLPAIQRPPLTVPGMRPHGAARPRTDCERPEQQDHRAAHSGQRPSHTGEHAARPAGRAQR